MKLINIGFGNLVAANRLLAVVSPDSAPIKRVIQEARFAVSRKTEVSINGSLRNTRSTPLSYNSM